MRERGSVGGHMVGTALARDDRAVPGPDPEPAAVMPVWAFEPEGGSDHVLVRSARLWGDRPVRRGAARRRRRPPGAGAAGARTVRPLGRHGAYVVFAAAAPA